VAVPDSLLADPSIAGPLGSLALSQVRPQSSSLALRALRWMEGLERLGVVLPFALVHDAGMLFAAPREQLALGPRAAVQALSGRSRDLGRLVDAYAAVLHELGES
jgi:hypothetical protein